MIFDLRRWDGKAGITIEEAHAPEFQDYRDLMILDLSLSFGIKSKITILQPGGKRLVVMILDLLLPEGDNSKITLDIGEVR
jgi:hypothetical protein